MPDVLCIAADAYRAMLSHLAADPEREACGLLIGSGRSAGRFEAIDNVAADPRCRYEMEPKQLIAAMKRLRRRGEALLGIVHSHVDTPASPSATDIAQATYPEAVYVIVSLKDPGRPEVRGWRLRPDCAPMETPVVTERDRG